MTAGPDVAPAGGDERTPAPGRPGDPIGGHYDPSAGSRLDWGLAEMPRPRKRGPRDQKSPRWRAERRHVPETVRDYVLTTRRLARHPLGLSRGEELEDGLPGAAKNMGDNARALLSHAVKRGGIRKIRELLYGVLFGYIRALFRSG